MRTFIIAAAAAFAVLAAGAVVGAQEEAAASVDAALEGADVAAEAAGADLLAGDSYEITPIVCPFKGRVAYEPGEISCGLLEVPENREKARPRKLQLHFVKLAARKPDHWDAQKRGEWRKRDDPIIYLTGGPGVTVTGYTRRLKDHGARDVRDMYILEQRGVGYSGDYCPLYFNIDPAAQNVEDWDAYQKARLKPIEDCFAAAKARGVDLSGYNSIENARDVRALRTALGLETWNVWGISYGSILGQAYLKADPEGVRAAVIDAIVPLKQGANFQTIGTFFRRDLDLLAGACGADPGCAAHFPDFIDRLESATAAVQKAPIVIDALDRELAPTGKVTLFHDIMVGLPFQLFYEQKNYGTMPAFIDALADLVEKRDFGAFSALTAAGGPAGFEISQGMYNAILCNDGWAEDLRRAIETDQAAEPLFGSIQGDPALADELVKICRRYGMPTRPAEQYQPVETAIRTVIANGAMDPITPPPLAKSILPGFSNGTYVEFPYAGHGPTRSVACGGDFLTKFYDDPSGELDTSCADEMKAPKFSGPLYATQGALRVAAFIGADPGAAPLAFLWFGAPAAFLIYAAFAYFFAPVGRILNGAGSVSSLGVHPLALASAFVGAASAIGLALAAAMSVQANQFLPLVGLLGFARWFAYAGLAAGVLGVFLLLSAFRRQRGGPIGIGARLGRFLTAAAAIAYAGFLAAFGFITF